MNYLAHSDPIFSILTEMLKRVTYSQKLIGKRLPLMEVQYSKQKNNLLGWRITGILLYLFTIAVLLVGSVYFVWSIVLISKATNPTTILQTILNILSLFVEVIGIFYTVMLFKHVSTTCFNPPSKISPEYPLQEYPLVSILLPIREANPTVLESSLNAIVQSNYPKEKIQIIVGDDTDPSYPEFKQIREICEKNNVDYIHDVSNLMFKAGMLNIMLEEVKAEYLVLLDYDHKISPDFVRKSVSKLLCDDDIAFVQSKVNFYNIKSRLQVWEAVMYAQFFEVFERSKNQRSTVLFNGSTACFRKRVIEEVGGIPTNTFTEDIDLSIQILTKGYKSTLIDEYGSLGLIPENFSLLLSQILRWAKGSMHTLKLRWKNILVGKLSIYDKIDLYFSTLLFFVASSMYLTILLYVIMFFTDSIAIRLPLQVFPPLIIMPIAFSVAYQISGLIAVIFARKDGLIQMKIIDLILFFIIALSLNPFTVYAVIRTLFRFRPPNRSRDKWNEKIPFIPLSILFSLLGAGILVVSYFDFMGTGTLWLVLCLLGLSLIATFPVCMYFHLTTRHNKPYFVAQNT